MTNRKKWTIEADAALMAHAAEQLPTDEIAKRLNRSPQAIYRRASTLKIRLDGKRPYPKPLVVFTGRWQSSPGLAFLSFLERHGVTTPALQAEMLDWSPFARSRYAMGGVMHQAVVQRSLAALAPTYGHLTLEVSATAYRIRSVDTSEIQLEMST
jgi:hypothetical protein